MNLWVTSITLDCINDLLHYLGMVARVDACFLYAQMRMIFNSDCFVRIISHNVFKHFFFTQYLSVLIIPDQPKPWGLIVEIVSDAKIIRSHFMHCFIWFISDNIFSCCEYIIWIPFSLIVYIVNIDCFLLFNLIICTFYYIINIINIHCLLFLLSLVWACICVRVISCQPTIFYFLFFRFTLGQIFYPFRARHISCNLSE